MKQLTKEQQEQAVKILEHLSKEDAFMNKDYYIEKAQAFLQSLKPKNYIAYLDGKEIVFLEEVENDVWTVNVEDAAFFYSYDEARKALNSVNKYQEFKYFILTE